MESTFLYTAESENGDVIVEPSEDAIFEMLSDLVLPNNTFIVIELSDSSFKWYAVVCLQENGSYEIEYREPRRNEHRVVVEQENFKLSRDLIIWLGEVLRS